MSDLAWMAWTVFAVVMFYVGWRAADYSLDGMYREIERKVEREREARDGQRNG